jgi:hypothetical protein
MILPSGVTVNIFNPVENLLKQEMSINLHQLFITKAIGNKLLQNYKN